LGPSPILSLSLIFGVFFSFLFFSSSSSILKLLV
jgi:hypothetical protein